MSAADSNLRKISNDLSRVEDANANIGVLLRAIGHISDLSAQSARSAFDQKNVGEGHVFSAACALDLITGLHSIAIDELDRASASRLSVDNAIYDLKQVTA